MYSSEGEKVDFVSVISTAEAKGSVEKWLMQVGHAAACLFKESNTGIRLPCLLSGAAQLPWCRVLSLAPCTEVTADL